MMMRMFGLALFALILAATSAATQNNVEAHQNLGRFLAQNQNQNQVQNNNGVGVNQGQGQDQASGRGQRVPLRPNQRQGTEQFLPPSFFHPIEDRERFDALMLRLDQIERAQKADKIQRDRQRIIAFNEGKIPGETTTDVETMTEDEMKQEIYRLRAKVARMQGKLQAKKSTGKSPNKRKGKPAIPVVETTNKFGK